MFFFLSFLFVCRVIRHLVRQKLISNWSNLERVHTQRSSKDTASKLQTYTYISSVCFFFCVCPTKGLFHFIEAEIYMFRRHHFCRYFFLVHSIRNKSCNGMKYRRIIQYIYIYILCGFDIICLIHMNRTKTSFIRIDFHTWQPQRHHHRRLYTTFLVRAVLMFSHTSPAHLKTGQNGIHILSLVSVNFRAFS